MRINLSLLFAAAILAFFFSCRTGRKIAKEAEEIFNNVKFKPKLSPIERIKDIYNKITEQDEPNSNSAEKYRIIPVQE